MLIGSTSKPSMSLCCFGNRIKESDVKCRNRNSQDPNAGSKFKLFSCQCQCRWRRGELGALKLKKPKHDATRTRREVQGEGVGAGRARSSLRPKVQLSQSIKRGGVKLGPIGIRNRNRNQKQKQGKGPTQCHIPIICILPKSEERTNLEPGPRF